MSFLVGDQKHTLFGFGRLDFIILNDELLLKDLDGVKLLGALGFCQHYLAKVTFAQDGQEVEMVQSNSWA